MISRNLAPSPEVQHLPTIFRRIQAGDIRIPAFQRGFIWKESQVLELLESIYKGYPIGSLLFWRVSSEILHIGFSEDLPFPLVEPKYPLCYVLDGMQRLSALYGVFHAINNKRDEFKVVFDFETEKFINTTSEESSELALPLDSLFVPKKLLEFHSTVLQNRNYDYVINNSLKLQSIFQEYLIPTVTISLENVSEVVEIFQRINSTGTKLGTVDFMRALTWSGSFDLNYELAEIQNTFESSGFIIDPETLVKIIAVVMGYDPIPAQMLKLKSESPNALKDGVKLAVNTIDHVIHFFKEEFSIYNSEMLPYEGILLGFTKIFSTNNNPSQSILSAAVKWFWSVSFNEALRGKPDHYVARSIHLLERIAQNDHTVVLDTSLDITHTAFFERRFIKGKALSIAFATMFAKNNARSLVTGEIIPTYEYMNGDAADAFIPIFPICKFKMYSQFDRYTSPKVFSNLFLTSHEDRKSIKGLSFETIISQLISKLGNKHAHHVLDSQFISDDFIRDDLLTNDLISLFSNRSLLMLDFAQRLVTA
ncbi:MAG: hypothetical protein ACD_19C00234G0001 [uncultured bacterium]|nr:MAG: hypothetical protein ACD_19C00234G0001 [uncultured bacterium]